MKKIEDLIVDKIIDLAHYMLSKIVKPDIEINTVIDLNKEALAKLKQNYGIEGIILDVDETIRKDGKMIPKCNRDWIENIKDEFKIVIVSNGIDSEVENYFKERNIDYIGFAGKPLKRNFTKACEKMNLNPENVLVIGDNIFDDIHGGNRSKMNTALVKEVEETER